MGLMDMLGKAMEGFTNGMQNMDMSNLSLDGLIPKDDGSPKPGEYCSSLCIYGKEMCEQCLEAQTKIKNGMLELQKLESLADSPASDVTNMMKAQITKCTLCGAPMERGLSECPYCDTSYPDNTVGFDIPLSKPERKTAAQKKAGEIWEWHCKVFESRTANMKANPNSGLIGKMSALAASGAGQNLIRQNAVQIQMAADHYGLPLSEYLYGAMRGQYKTYPQLLSEKTAAYRKQENEERLQMKREEHERWTRRFQENHQRELDNIKALNYGGGSGGGTSSTGSCCGNCRYYTAGNKECLYFKGTSGQYRSGPADGCNNYRSLY